jgi:hypothetical protein
MDEVLRTCARTWRRIGVSRSAAEEMARELRADLEAAAGAGVDAQAYVGGDAAGLARAWASARGLVRPRYHLVGCMAVALLVVVPMVFAASFIYIAVTSAFVADIVSPGWDLVRPGPFDGDGAVRPFVSIPLPLFVGWYVAAAVAGVAGILLGVGAYLRLWADPARRDTVRALAVVLLPAAAVAGFAVAGVSKALEGYRSTPVGQVAQYATFVVVLVAFVGATRAIVVLARRRRPATAGEDSLALA